MPWRTFRMKLNFWRKFKIFAHGTFRELTLEVGIVEGCSMVECLLKWEYLLKNNLLEFSSDGRHFMLNYTQKYKTAITNWCADKGGYLTLWKKLEVIKRNYLLYKYVHKGIRVVMFLSLWYKSLIFCSEKALIHYVSFINIQVQRKVNLLILRFE